MLSRVVWIPIVLVPAAIVAVFVLPSSSQTGHGLLAELIANLPLGGSAFRNWADGVRGTLIASLAVAWFVGVLLWFWDHLGWGRLVGKADSRLLPSYRVRTVRLALVSLAAALVTGLGVALGDDRIRGLAVGAWIVIGLTCAVVGFSAFWSLVFGLWPTRRDFQGRW